MLPPTRGVYDPRPRRQVSLAFMFDDRNGLEDKEEGWRHRPSYVEGASERHRAPAVVKFVRQGRRTTHKLAIVSTLSHLRVFIFRTLGFVLMSVVRSARVLQTDSRSLSRLCQCHTLINGQNLCGKEKQPSAQLRIAGVYRGRQGEG